MEQVSTSTSGGVRAYARHRGVSHGAVTKAVKAGRLADAATFVDGRTVIDFARADALWPESRQHLTAGVFRASRETAPLAHLAIGPEYIGAYAEDGLVIVGCLRPDGRRPNADDSFILPLLPETARLLAARLLAKAGEIEGAQNL